MTDVIAEAEKLGCELECVRFNQQPDRWYWRLGMRSSADQHAASFADAEEAAKHFLTSHEAQIARRARKQRT